MTAPTHTVPAQTDAQAQAAEETAMADLVLGGRVMSTARHLAGAIALGQVDTVGRPSKLPRDLWPEQDPALVQEIWDRAFVTGFRTGQFAGSPRYYRDKLERLQRELEEAGFVAMAGLAQQMVTMAQELEPAAHPADAEAGRERPDWV